MPIGVATALAAARILARDRPLGLERGADSPGAVLLVTAVMLGVYTIVEAAEQGWGSTRTLGLGALAIALLTAFVVRESRARNPLVPLEVFRSRTVSMANVVMTLTVAGLFGLFFLGVLYTERVLGYDAIEIGLAFLPVALAIATLSLGAAARLILRFGAWRTLIPGLALMAAAMLWFARVPVDGSYVVDLLPAMLGIGIGAGLMFPALTTLAMSAATAEDSGLASGLVSTSQQVGGALGLAVLATLSASRTESLLGGGAQAAEAMTSGYRLAFAVGGGLVLVALALAVATARGRSAVAAQPEAAAAG